MPETDDKDLPGRDDAAAYAFWDGSRRRVIDPLEAAAVLEAECPEHIELFEIVTQEVPESMAALLAGTPVAADLKGQQAEAKDKLVAVARKMFGLAPLGEGVGLGRKGVMDVLMGFFAHMRGMATEARPFETSQPRDSPSIAPASPGESCAASGSPGR